jgi:hypothetical protein
VKAAAVLLVLAACDPIYGVTVRVHDPSKQPVENATLAIGCPDSENYAARNASVRTTATGEAHVGGLGSRWPVGCDVFVVKPGFHAHRIRYRDICPKGPDDCNRVFSFDLELTPE